MINVRQQNVQSPSFVGNIEVLKIFRTPNAINFIGSMTDSNPVIERYSWAEFREASFLKPGLKLNYISYGN